MNPADSPLYALLVGVGSYSRLPPERQLPNAHNDAEDLKQLIADERPFIPRTKNVEWLPNEKASKHAIITEITGRLASAPPDSTVLFYFAGHGIHVRDGNAPGSYLLLADADPKQPLTLTDHALSARELQEALERVGAKRQLVILDCCHAQGMLPSRDVVAFMEGDAELAMSGLHRKGRALLAACRTEQVAFEAERNGLLTKHLLEGLRGAAASLDGEISLLDLAGYVLRQVHSASSQIPVFGANDLDYYPLARCDPDRVLDHNEWQLIYHKLKNSRLEVLDDLLVLFDLPRSHGIKQSQNDKATLLINKVRERGPAGRLEIDRYLTLDSQHTQVDVLRRRISQDLRHLNFVPQGRSFEIRIRRAPNRGAFIIHGAPLMRTDLRCTAHRWLLRQLLFRIDHPESLDEAIIPVNMGTLSRDSRDNNIRFQLARALGVRRREWPDLVASASARESSIFIIEPIEELSRGELEGFLTQFWGPLNRALDQRAKLRGPVLLFLLSYDDGTSSSVVQSSVSADGAASSTNDPQWLDRVGPLELAAIDAWLERVRGDWGDDPEVGADLSAKLEATDILPHDIFEHYVEMRLTHLSEDQWSRAKDQLEIEWFLLNLPKR